MKRALALAARARGRTAPNPMVGAVIVRAGKAIAEGWHHKAGSAHAEVDALGKLKPGKARGATVYVTLEPCNHTGRTGPCVEALVDAGPKRVVIGMHDPNPDVVGGGAARLRHAGIDVVMGVCEAECRALNEEWIVFITEKRPFVTLKAAVTLDGRLAARGGDSRWVSGEASRKEAHKLRAQSDAILVGAGTVRSDDPQLTVRSVKGNDPLRVILDGKLSMPAGARALPALVMTSEGTSARGDLVERGAEIVTVPGRDGRVDLRAMLGTLAARGVVTLLVEGGGDVHGQLLEAGLVDRVALFIAPKIVGAGGVPLVSIAGPDKMEDAWKVEPTEWKRVGDDTLLVGRMIRKI